MHGDYPYCGANGVLDYVNDYVIDDLDLLNDLAGRSKKTVAPDIVDYIENNPKIVSLLRSAKNNKLSEDEILVRKVFPDTLVCENSEYSIDCKNLEEGDDCGPDGDVCELGPEDVKIAVVVICQNYTHTLVIAAQSTLHFQF